MSISIFRREEIPVPSRRVKAVYAVFVVLVLLVYSITMVMNDKKPGKVAKLINKARTMAGAMVSFPE